jgi:DNA-binding transcriptional regulator YhcF (GntR family)
MNDKTDTQGNAKPPLLLLLELNSEIPLYQQIRDQIVMAMAGGRLPDGTPLPTTRQLALDFGINFHTVNKAYDLLRQEGFVSLTRKQGSFVRRAPDGDVHKNKDWQVRLRTLLAEAIARGQPADEVLEICRVTLETFLHLDVMTKGK